MKKILTSKMLVSFGYCLFLCMVVLVLPYTEPVNAREPAPNQRTGTRDLQYAPNMRYASPDISYRISNCPGEKVLDIKRALEIISGKTILSFAAIESEEDLLISCTPSIFNDNPREDGSARLGKGSPEYILGEKFHVITHGDVYLKRSFACDEPLVEIHEILHAFGYDHSSNKQHIMYPRARCGQMINSEITDDINNIYAIPSLPDLSIGNATLKKGRNNDSILTFKMKNLGLVKSKKALLVIYDIDNQKMLDEYEVEGIDIDENRGGRIVYPFTVSVLKLEIIASFDELEKENNIVELIAD